MCLCVLLEFRQFVLFFFSGNSSTYFKVLMSIFAKKKKKKSDRTSCLAFQFLSAISDPKLLGPRYNIYWNSKSAEWAKAKEERNSVVIHR